MVDGPLWVAPYRDTGVIGTVERLWHEPGVTLEEAFAEAERLMPGDARRVDVYQVPPARILHEDDVCRSTSELLRERFGGEAADLRSGFVVIVEQRPLSSSFESRSPHDAPDTLPGCGPDQDSQARSRPIVSVAFRPEPLSKITVSSPGPISPLARRRRAPAAATADVGST